MSHHLDDLYLFTQVANGGGISAVSRSLRLQKSTVARRIAALEATLSQPLFHRTGQGLVLTNFGSEVYARCLGMVREADKVFDFAAESREQVSGNLHIVYPPVLGELMIERLAAEFALAEPNLRLQLEATTKLIDPRTIAADVVLHFRFDELPDADFIARRIFQSPYVLTATPGLIGDTPPSRPQDLDRFPKVGYGLGPKTWAWRLSRGREERVYEFAPVLNSTQISALLIAVRMGVGIGSLPLELVRKDLAEGRLTTVLPRWSPEPVTLFALYPSGRTLTTAARLFISLLSERLPVTMGGAGLLHPENADSTTPNITD